MVTGNSQQWLQALAGGPSSGVGVSEIDAKVSVLGHVSPELSVVLSDSDSPNTHLTTERLAWSQMLPMYHCVSWYRNPVRRHRRRD